MFETVGVMVESSREEKKGQGNQEEINRFFVQMVHTPKTSSEHIDSVPDGSPPLRPLLLFIFALFAQKGKRIICLDGGGPGEGKTPGAGVDIGGTFL